MRRFRLFIIVALLLASAGLSACLTGGGSTGFGPGSPSASPSSGSILAPPSTGTGPSSGDGITTPPGAAAAGGDDTMPPRADASDCMNYGIDGTVYCGPPRREECRIYYVPAAKMKVFAGHGSPLPPIPMDGKSPLNGHFYVETGYAPLECEDASCWTWQSADAGNYVRMRLTRPQPSAPALQFYQDAAVTPPASDESNVFFPGVPVQNGDEIEFSYTYSDMTPYGTSASLVPLTDDVWTHYGVKCDMGGFRIEAPVTIEYKKSDVPSPTRDLIERPDFLVR